MNNVLPLCRGLCQLVGHKIGVALMRKTHVHYLVPLAYLEYTVSRGLWANAPKGVSRLVLDV